METISKVIYKAFNNKRKCFYIGLSFYPLERRMKVHYRNAFRKQLQYKLYHFIRKYGWDSFVWEVLEVCTNWESLYEAEIRILDQQKKLFPNWECLNTAPAGKGGDLLTNNPRIEEIRKNLSIARKKYLSAHPEQMRGEHHPFWHHSHKEKTKELQSKKRIEYLQSHPNALLGENNGRSKLTQENIIEIRRLIKENRLSSKEIYTKFFITKGYFHKIKKNQFWKGVE